MPDTDRSTQILAGIEAYLSTHKNFSKAASTALMIWSTQLTEEFTIARQAGKSGLSQVLRTILAAVDDELIERGILTWRL